MYEITVAIRTVLLNNPKIAGIVGSRIYPMHVSGVKNPTFPAITLSRSGTGTDLNRLVTDTEYHLDIWSKTGYDELWTIYEAVRNSLDLVELSESTGAVFKGPDGLPRPVKALIMRETFVEDDLYEPNTLTYHLAARYRAMAIK